MLINPSGSGKTPLLLEGLYHRWGFYFVVKQDTTSIGSRDFALFMSQLDDAKDYGEAKKRSESSVLDPGAVDHIRQVARARLAQMLSARFLLLGLLVQEASNLPGGYNRRSTVYGCFCRCNRQYLTCISRKTFSQTSRNSSEAPRPTSWSLGYARSV